MPLIIGPELALENEVERLLRENHWTFQREVVMGDARPDFVVTTDAGDRIIIEVKSWDASTLNTARAINQAQQFRKLSKATAAIVVTKSGDRVTIPEGGVVPINLFPAFLLELVNSTPQRNRASKTQTLASPPNRTVFASMPFASQYDDTYLVAIEPAALAYGAIAERVDHSGTTGPVVPQIQEKIRSSKVIIADISESRPNVLHEVGFAEALKIPVIQICSTPINQLPFNVRNNQTIQYSIGQSARLRKKLEERLKALL